MVSERVYKLCNETETVSSALAKDPTLAPGDAIKRIYGDFSNDLHHSPDGQPASSLQAVEAAFSCGRWGIGNKPSPLFLQAFADSLNCLDADPMAGVVSPPLMGSHGTVPLTVIAPLADIIRHCSNLIVCAEKEVFFITCAWSPSVAQRLIKNALVELSRRAGRRGRRVVVKMMYDRAGPSNAVRPHQYVKPSTYAGKSIQLPTPDEIPNIDLEVISLHKMPLGTLHAKLCVIDRKIACVMSNNIEDNDNLEMMTHLEGPIVDSIYDTALITWNNSLNPPLPSHQTPAAEGGLPTSSHEALYLDRSPGRGPEKIAADGHDQSGLPENTPEDAHYDGNLSQEITRMQRCYSNKPDETRLQAANRQLNVSVKNSIDPTGPEIPNGQEMTPYVSTMTSHPIPMALVNRPPYACVDTTNAFVPQNEAWLSLIRNAKQSIFIQTPDLNAAPLISAISAALERGVEVTYYVCFGYNDLGEMIPGQGGTNDQAAQALIASLPLDGPERKLLHIYNYVGKDQNRPIHNSFKSRSCHIKLLIVDNCVGIQGSGNQDTQSWFHSQEVNVMVDSREICEKWREVIDRNQNTKMFGKVAEDGIWRDKDGSPGKGYMGNPGKIEGLLKGVAGMAMKMEGMGGF
ncbi:IQ calmodulin-binding motif protein [Thelonectria olida]|uniref:IQ calmodulin-binding motif protein n=1 Tax=Thelonectria olida TaxID=1576542 RepID=A0A9P8VUR1_9HYPO|nr:IQ calmodulin-binding motif protein [Thelonectria olida]